MKTWITIFLMVLLLTALIVALAAICAMALLGFAKRYRRRTLAEDTRMVENHLPGTDCGACGQDSCRSFAEQAACDGKLPKGCPYLTEQTGNEIDTALEKRETELRAHREAAKKADRAAGIEH